MADDRIGRLSQRFKTHAVGRRANPKRARERKSFYIDAELVKQLDLRYRELNHEMYPKSVSKSAFLETLLEYGLDHLEDFKGTLAALGDDDERSDT